jgi:hypothetical protein
MRLHGDRSAASQIESLIVPDQTPSALVVKFHRCRAQRRVLLQTAEVAWDMRWPMGLEMIVPAKESRTGLRNRRPPRTVSVIENVLVADLHATGIGEAKRIPVC